MSKLTFFQYTNPITNNVTHIYICIHTHTHTHTHSETHTHGMYAHVRKQVTMNSSKFSSPDASESNRPNTRLLKNVFSTCKCTKTSAISTSFESSTSIALKRLYNFPLHDEINTKERIRHIYNHNEVTLKINKINT